MTAVLLSLTTFVSTLAGGMLALRLAGQLHFILAFTAGVLIGVAAFDVLPEAFELAHAKGIDPTNGMIAFVAGFLLFHGLQRLLFPRRAGETGDAAQRHPRMGVVLALALAGHSFMDGVGIGLGFQVSNSVGVAVAIAVIAHDFCDGLNTVSLMFVHGNTRLSSKLMLLLGAAAPVAGAASTLLFAVPTGVIVAYLGFFGGFLLYVAAADILPKANVQGGSAIGLLALTTLGAAIMFVVSQFIG